MVPLSVLVLRADGLATPPGHIQGARPDHPVGHAASVVSDQVAQVANVSEDDLAPAVRQELLDVRCVFATPHRVKRLLP
eukprot:14759804-Alexandrium_andersonii.AAC.1